MAVDQFTKLRYHEVETRKISEFETSFSVEPLERGFANTLGNVLRRTLISAVSTASSFAVRIENVAHEFQTITGVHEDAVQLILNLKKIRFIYNEALFANNAILRVSLKGPKGEVRARDLTLPAGLEVVNPDEYIASTTKSGALNLELFVTAGRGYSTFEENKTRLKFLAGKLESKLTTGAIIAIDADFSPVVNVSYESVELNTSAAIVEERLVLNVRTDGSVSARDAVAKAAHILISHLEVFANVANIMREAIFVEPVPIEKPSPISNISIAQLDLSVRSFNCLRRAGFENLPQLAKISKKELSEIKNLGKKSVDEIIEKLAAFDVILAEGA